MKTMYQSEDGKLFDTPGKCNDHERSLRTKDEELFRQYIEVSYSGRMLLTKHKLSDVGIWKVRGEDPNCDMGGAHHMPDLGIYSGKLIDVIKKAIKLPGFWTWGGGGDFTKVEVKEV